MQCSHCDSHNIRKLSEKTALNYHKYFCRNCHRQYNERTGTALNFIEYPTEVVMMAFNYYYRFKVSLDDVVELMTMRGFNMSHQTIHNWTQTFEVKLGLKLRSRSHGATDKKWYVDATYIKIEGRWCYLYRAIDKAGNLVDLYLSDVRNQAATEAFFRQAVEASGVIPEQITTDKEPALYPSIKIFFGDDTMHRDSKYKNNCLEQDHRGIKSRYKPMKGFKNPLIALIFCTAFEEIRRLFLIKNKTRSKRRRLITSKIREFYQLEAATA